MRTEEAVPVAKGGLGPNYGSGEQVALARCDYEEKEECDDLLPLSGDKKSDRHHPHLDITRICCVWFVCIDHADSTFGVWNSLFAQDWVLQYLFLVSGVCFGMSRKSLLDYHCRLLLYFLIGFAVNLTAWMLMGLDWKDNMFNVVFHLWFVVGLVLYTLLLAPLRPYLAKVREQRLRGPDVPAHGTESPEVISRDQRSEQIWTVLRVLAVVGGGVMIPMVLLQIVVRPLLEQLAGPFYHLTLSLGAGAEFWGFPTTPEESYEFLARLCSYFQLTLTNIYLILICPMVFSRSSLIGWLLLLNTYGHRIFFYRAKDERPFHGLDLTLIGLACYYLGLQHRRKIGQYVVRYWFVVAFVCAVLWPPGLSGRLDENPPLDASIRMRVNLMEAIFVTCWLVAGERLVQKEIFTEDRLDFLNDWSLIVFLVHKAVHIMLAPPFNWVFLVGLAPVCHLCRQNTPKPREPR